MKYVLYRPSRICCHLQNAAAKSCPNRLHSSWLATVVSMLCCGLLLSPGMLLAQAFDETEYGELSQRFMKHFDATEYREAEPLARRILEIAPRLYPGKALPHGKALQNLAEVLLRLEKLDEAGRIAAQGVLKFQQVGEPGKLALADGFDLQGRIATAAGKYREGEKLLKQGLEIRESVWGPLHDHVGKSQANLGALYVATGQHTEAEKALKAALGIFERMLGPQHFFVADAATNLGLLLETLGRTQDAEALHLRSLAIRERVFGPESWGVAGSLQNLANSYKNQGRFSEADSTTRRALAIYQKTLPANHPSLGDMFNNLGNIADDQNHFDEALKFYSDALANYQQAYGPNHPRVAMALNNLALANQSLQRYKEAETLLQQAYDLRVKILGEHKPDTLETLANIGSNHWWQGRFDEALKIDELLLEVRQKTLGKNHPEVVSSLRNLAVTLRSLNKLPRAEELLSQAIELARRQVLQPRDVARLYDLRARTRYEQQRPAEAIEDLTEAIDQSELQRRYASGGEVERAKAFAQQGDIYERMIAWSIERKDLAAAWSAAERSRARTLLDQLELRGGDLLAGVGWRIARPLRKRETDARTRLAQLEQTLQRTAAAAGVTPAERERQMQMLEPQLLAARRDVIDAYREIRNASPAYRLMLAQDFKPAETAAVDSWLQSMGGVMLRYYIGTNSSWVFIIRPGQDVEVLPLSIPPESIAAGAGGKRALTDSMIREIVLGGATGGVLSQLNHPENAHSAVPRLHSLWKTLVPATFREELLQDKYRLLVVIPDGALATLPFDALVIEPGGNPQYLLDSGPPICYAPSATLLLNLASRQPLAESRGVLTLGDAIYPGETDGAARGTPASRYLELGGRFPRLPHSGTEAQWVARSFNGTDQPVKLLERQAATEAAVRQESAKKRFVHLACHGFCDDAHNNFFGALVVTKGPQADGAANDGFLTVTELVELPLQGCELSILSACETNLGPQQQGEAVWALSRGVLAAGARRVIASDWLVDDEAAATLISQLCQGLAGNPSQAVAHQLQSVKRLVRSQDKWKSPYYWGGFVLIGPP